MLWIGGLMLVLMAPLLVIMISGGFPAAANWMGISLFIAPFATIAAVAVDFPRLYIYIALLAFAILQSELLLDYIAAPLSPFISFGLPGAAILVFGLILLAGFLKKYPKVDAEAFHVG